jgi:hypothetical protein
MSPELLAWTGLKLLIISISASQVARITSVSQWNLTMSFLWVHMFSLAYNFIYIDNFLLFILLVLSFILHIMDICLHHASVITMPMCFCDLHLVSNI